MHAVIVFALTVVLLQSPSAASAASGAEIAQSTPDRTKLMQQSDHQRRLDEQRKDRAHEMPMDAVTPPQSQAAGSDYAVLVILVASMIILLSVSKRRKKNQSRL